MFKNNIKKKFVFALAFPGVAYQPHSSFTVYAAFVADVGSWLRIINYFNCNSDEIIMDVAGRLGAQIRVVL